MVTYNLKYDVTGKITGIYADAALTQLKVAYYYDESGNRIARVDYTGTTPQTTYTVYDASGNPLAIYNNTTQAEVPIYGSERLGTYSPTFNSYAYELRDNVGSVRVVISNTKTPTGQANVFTYNDYYPFGSTARSGGVTYRYEYQGAYAEKDPITGFNNFDLRMYDGRIGRWLSTDPNAQYYSPYVGMGNDPVSLVDPDGGETGDPTYNGGSLPEVVVTATRINKNYANISYGPNARQILSDYTIRTLQDLARASGERNFLINSTYRTAQDQARAMLQNINSRGMAYNLNLYNGKPGSQVVLAYQRTGTLEGMVNMIEKLGPANVSSHSKPPTKIQVVDISARFIVSPHRLKVALNQFKSEGTISKFIPPPRDPAFHIEIPQPQP